MSLAPDVFDVDEHGVAHVLTSGALAPAQEGAARRAVVNCPEEAIELIDEREESA